MQGESNKLSVLEAYRRKQDMFVSHICPAEQVFTRLRLKPDQPALEDGHIILEGFISIAEQAQDLCEKMTHDNIPFLRVVRQSSLHIIIH